MTAGWEANGQYETAAATLAALDAVREAGGLIHDLPGYATHFLATEYNTHTTEMPEYPGTYREYSKAQRIHSALGQQALNGELALTNVPGYKDANREGEEGVAYRAASALLRISTVEGHDVRVDSSEASGDKVVIGRTIFTVATEKDAKLINGLFQSWSRPEDGFKGVHTVFTDKKEDESYTVIVYDLNEYTIRNMGSALDQMVAERDYAEFGVALPDNKRTLKTWEQEGHTFPPEYRKRLEERNLAYQLLKVKVDGTYVGEPNMQPDKRDDLLGTDAAPVFQAMRDIVRPMIEKIRSGTHLNEEQDPDKSARTLIERGIDKRRDPGEPNAVKQGPLSPRVPHLKERIIETQTAVTAHAKKHPVRTTIKLATKAVWAGVDLLADGLVEIAPLAGRAGKAWRDRRREWRFQKELAVEAGNHLDRIRADIRSKVA